MDAPTLQAQVDAARAYEALFVPALFRQWAPKVADAARVGPGGRALDVGCGTGVVARELAVRTGPTGRVAGIDASPGMLEVARELTPSVDWHQGVAESLPFADQSFDAVVCQFALMFFTERRQALRDMLRVLTPGGQLVVVVWDTLDSMPAYASEVALIESMAGRAAAEALCAPFVLGNRKELATLFADAGVTVADISTDRGTANFPSLRTMVEADLRGWLPVMGVVLTEDLIGRILQEAERALSPYATADGRASFALSAHFVTATKH